MDVTSPARLEPRPPAWTARAYALAALLASLAAFPAPAEADMVVIASTAPEVLLGRIVQPGQPLRLPEGSQVTLLASTGATMIMVPPGGTVSDIPSVKGDSEVLTTLAAIVAGGEGSARLGAARALSDTVCTPRPEVDTVREIARLGLEGCAKAAGDLLDDLRRRRVPASLYLTSERGRQATAKPGEALRLEVSTSLAAFVACWHQQSDGSVLPLAVEGAAAGRPLPSSRPHSLRLTVEGEGRTLVACTAATRAIDGAVAGDVTLADLQARAGGSDGFLAADQIAVQISP
jgi:hypothetical protein